MDIINMSYKELDRAGVIERVLARQLTQIEAACQLRVSERQVRRLCRRVEQDGPAAVALHAQWRRSALLVAPMMAAA